MIMKTFKGKFTEQKIARQNLKMITGGKKQHCPKSLDTYEKCDAYWDGDADGAARCRKNVDGCNA